MTITLTTEQRAWIDAHVASGEYASVEEAARRLLDHAMSFRDGACDDLSWAKPYLDKALAEVERGETISAVESHTDLAAMLERLKTR